MLHQNFYLGDQKTFFTLALKSFSNCSSLTHIITQETCNQSGNNRQMTLPSPPPLGQRTQHEYDAQIATRQGIRVKNAIALPNWLIEEHKS